MNLMNRNIQENITNWNLRHILGLFKKVSAREENFLRYRLGLTDKKYTEEELNTNVMAFINLNSIEDTARYFNISIERAQALEHKLTRQLSGYIRHKNRSLKLKAFLEN